MAFNVGTLGHISQPGDGAKIALAVTNTVLSGASGGLSALFFRRFGLFVTREEEKTAWSFLLTVNGIFVGMVGVNFHDHKAFDASFLSVVPCPNIAAYPISWSPACTLSLSPKHPMSPALSWSTGFPQIWQILQRFIGMKIDEILKRPSKFSSMYICCALFLFGNFGFMMM